MRNDVRMETKNIRIRPETHDLLVQIAKREGRFQHAVVDLALLAYNLRWSLDNQIAEADRRMTEIYGQEPVEDLPFDPPE